MGEEISQRLVTIRKHLSNRLDEKLLTEQIAVRCGLKTEQVYRLEHGLSGTPNSLVTLINYYQSQGYNLEWIFATDNSRIPMVTPSSRQLQLIAEQFQKLGQQLTAGYGQLSAQLEEIGLGALEMGVVAGTVVELPDAEGIAI